MRRRLLNLAVGISSLLALFIAAAWIRSYSVRDLFEFYRHAPPEPSHVDQWWGKITLNDGHIFLHLQSVRSTINTTPENSGPWRPPDYQPLTGFEHSTDTASDLRRPWYPQYTDIGAVTSNGTFERREARLHFCIPELLALTLPAVTMRNHLRRTRLRRTGHCPRCTYDLRSSPGPCPECGDHPPHAIAVLGPTGIE